MKKPGPTGWRGVMNQRPRPSDFGLSPLAGDVDSITQRQRVRVSRISHGIGGGMRVHEEADVFRRVTPQKRSTPAPSIVSLTASRAAFGVYAAALVAGLMIAHVHLRFQIHDMNIQQHALQSVETRLQRQSNVLNQELTSLIDVDRLKDYAQNQWGMVYMEEAPEVVVKEYTAARYDEKQIVKERTDKQQELAEAENGTTRRPFRDIATFAWALANK